MRIVNHRERDDVDDNGPTGLPASIEAAWGLRQRPNKGPKPTLSLQRIVQAAVKVADADGLAAVSMSRVANDLGVSTMSLYRYVAAKDELLTLMVDEAAGPPPAASRPEEGWRAGLSRWARAELAFYRRHRWALRVPISGPPLTPNQTAWLEQGLRSLHGTGLDEGEKLGVILLLTGYVRSSATIEADIVEAFLASATTPDAAMSTYRDLLAAVTDEQRFPALHAVIQSGVLDRADPPDAEFDFGLERVLDGVDALVRARGPQR